MRIGVIDSGIGGLTVLKELIKKYPNNQYIYYGDTLNNPYGSKNKYQLFKLSKKMIDYLISQNVDVIVIACGTISANIYQELQMVSSVKLYSIIEPVIEYINNHQEKIGIIATEMTIKSGLFNDVNFKCACPMFVPLIENREFNELDKYINKYLRKCHVDTLIMGCTHYPIIEDKLEKYFKGQVKLINMGSLLELESKDNKRLDVKINYSLLNEKIIRNTKEILDLVVFEIEEVK